MTEAKNKPANPFFDDGGPELHEDFLEVQSSINAVSTEEANRKLTELLQDFNDTSVDGELEEEMVDFASGSFPEADLAVPVAASQLLASGDDGDADLSEDSFFSALSKQVEEDDGGQQDNEFEPFSSLETDEATNDHPTENATSDGEVALVPVANMGGDDLDLTALLPETEQSGASAPKGDLDLLVDDLDATDFSDVPAVLIGGQDDPLVDAEALAEADVPSLDAEIDVSEVPGTPVDLAGADLQASPDWTSEDLSEVDLDAEIDAHLLSDQEDQQPGAENEDASSVTLTSGDEDPLALPEVEVVMEAEAVESLEGDGAIGSEPQVVPEAEVTEEVEVVVADDDLDDLLPSLDEPAADFAPEVAELVEGAEAPELDMFNVGEDADEPDYGDYAGYDVSGGDVEAVALDETAEVELDGVEHYSSTSDEPETDAQAGDDDLPEAEAVGVAMPEFQPLEGEGLPQPVRAPVAPGAAVPAPEAEIAEPTEADYGEQTSAEQNSKKRKNGVWKWLLAASVGTVLLAGGGGYAWYMTGMPGVERVIALVPGLDPIARLGLPTVDASDDQQAAIDFGAADPVAIEFSPAITSPETVAATPISPATPVEASQEIDALFAELDGLAASVDLSPSPGDSAPEAEAIQSDDLSGFEVEEFDAFDFGQESQPDQEVAAEGEIDPEISVPAPGEEPAAGAGDLEAPAPAIAETSVPADLDSGVMSELSALRALVADIQNASSTGISGEVVLEIARLGEQISVINARLQGVEARLATVQAAAITLPGTAPQTNANEAEIRELRLQMENLANNVGVLARLAAPGAAGNVPGFNAITQGGGGDVNVPMPTPRPTNEAPRVSDSPAEAAGFTISSPPKGDARFARVAKGDFVDGYGYVLNVMPASSGGRLVVMENGTVLVD